jgi:hypothetical protein
MLNYEIFQGYSCRGVSHTPYVPIYTLHLKGFEEPFDLVVYDSLFVCKPFFCAFLVAFDIIT